MQSVLLWLLQVGVAVRVCMLKVRYRYCIALYSPNAKQWKFTLISEWLLFNSNRVDFSSKRAEKRSAGHSRSRANLTRVSSDPNFTPSRNELLANQRCRKSLNICWADATRWRIVCGCVVKRKWIWWRNSQHTLCWIHLRVGHNS